MSYRSKALTFAVTQLGVREQPAGTNDGPRVRVYQTVTGEFRQPWCASFVQWCFLQAGYPQPLFLKSAYVPTFVSQARKLGWVVGNPQPGDLACYDWQNDGIADHIGIVESVSADGSFTAIEGNTAVGQDSNGGEVMRRRRSPHDVQAFIRVPGAPPVVKPPVKKPHPVYRLVQRLINGRFYATTVEKQTK